MAAKVFVAIVLCGLYIIHNVKGSACPSNQWSLEQGYCYIRKTGNIDYSSAETACQGLGGYLATIADSGENTRISSVNPAGLGSSQKFWIGLTKNASTSLWVLNDNVNTTYFNWGFSPVVEPDGTGDCTVFGAGAYWYDEDCTSTVNGYICEKAGICTAAQTLAHATSNSTLNFIGTVNGYTCHTGWEFSDGTESKSVECLDSGAWSETLTDCVRKNCSTPPTVNNAGIEPGYTTLYESEVNYTCNPGYQFSLGVEQTIITCNASATWNDTPAHCTLKNCPAVQTISNGGPDTTANTAFTTVLYSCNTGYEFSDNETMKYVTCQVDATWNDTASNCRIKDCVTVPTIPNATPWSSPTTTYGSLIRYTCDANYHFSAGVYYKYIQCGSDKLWSPDPATLTPTTLDCSDPPPYVANATVNYTTVNFGSVANYSCFERYKFPDANDSKIVTCDGNGLWTPVIPPCENVLVPCPTIISPNYTTLTGDNSTAAFSWAILTCDDGYRFPTGEKVRNMQCLSSLWNDTIEACQVMSCGAFPTYNNISVYGTGSLFGDSLTYTCDVNGTVFPEGTTSRTVRCVDAGWSPPTLPECKAQAVVIQVKPPDPVPVEAAVEVVVATATVPMALVVGFLCSMVALDLATISKHVATMKANLQYFFNRLKGEPPPERKKKKKAAEDQVQLLCKHCKEEGHRSRDCPICRYCKTDGHTTKECPLLNKYCDVCGYHGHLPEECDDSDVERIQEEEEEEEEEVFAPTRPRHRKKSFDSGIVNDWKEWDPGMSYEDAEVAFLMPALVRDDFKFRRALSCPPRSKKIQALELMTLTPKEDTGFVPVDDPNDIYRALLSPTEFGRDHRIKYGRGEFPMFSPAHTPMPEDMRVPTPVYRPFLTPTESPPPGYAVYPEDYGMDAVPSDHANVILHHLPEPTPPPPKTPPFVYSMRGPYLEPTEPPPAHLDVADPRIDRLLFSPDDFAAPADQTDYYVARPVRPPSPEKDDDDWSDGTDADEVVDELLRLTEDMDPGDKPTKAAQDYPLHANELVSSSEVDLKDQAKDKHDTLMSPTTPGEQVPPRVYPKKNPVRDDSQGEMILMSRTENEANTGRETAARDQIFTPLYADNQPIVNKVSDEEIPEPQKEDVISVKRSAVSLQSDKHQLDEMEPTPDLIEHTQRPKSATSIAVEEQRSRQCISPSVSPVPAPRARSNPDKRAPLAEFFHGRSIFTPLPELDRSQAIPAGGTAPYRNNTSLSIEPAPVDLPDPSQRKVDRFPSLPTGRPVVSPTWELHEVTMTTNRDPDDPDFRPVFTPSILQPDPSLMRGQRATKVNPPTLERCFSALGDLDLNQDTRLYKYDNRRVRQLDTPEPELPPADTPEPPLRANTLNLKNAVKSSPPDEKADDAILDQRCISPSTMPCPRPYEHHPDPWKDLFGRRNIFTPLPITDPSQRIPIGSSEPRRNKDAAEVVNAVQEKPGVATLPTETQPIVEVEQKQTVEVVQRNETKHQQQKPQETKAQPEKEFPKIEPEKQPDLTALATAEELRYSLFTPVDLPDPSQRKVDRFPSLPTGRPVVSPTWELPDQTSRDPDDPDFRPVFTPSILHPDPSLMRGQRATKVNPHTLERCFSALGDLDLNQDTRLYKYDNRRVRELDTPEPELPPADTPIPSPVPEFPPADSPVPFEGVDPMSLIGRMITPTGGIESTENDSGPTRNIFTPFYDEEQIVKPEDPRLRKPISKVQIPVLPFTPPPTEADPRQQMGGLLSPTDFYQDDGAMDDDDLGRISPVSEASLPLFDDDPDRDAFPWEFDEGAQVFTPTEMESDMKSGDNAQRAALLTPMCALEPSQRVKEHIPATKIKELGNATVRPMSVNEEAVGLPPAQTDNKANNRPSLMTPLFDVDPTQECVPGRTFSPEKNTPRNPLKTLVARPISASESPREKETNKKAIGRTFSPLSMVDINPQFRTETPHEWPYVNQERPVFTPLAIQDPTQMITNRGMKEWNMEKPQLQPPDRYQAVFSPDIVPPSDPEERLKTPEVYAPSYTPPPRELPSFFTPPATPEPTNKIDWEKVKANQWLEKMKKDSTSVAAAHGKTWLKKLKAKSDSQDADEYKLTVQPAAQNTGSPAIIVRPSSPTKGKDKPLQDNNLLNVDAAKAVVEDEMKQKKKDRKKRFKEFAQKAAEAEGEGEDIAAPDGAEGVDGERKKKKKKKDKKKKMEDLVDAAIEKDISEDTTGEKKKKHKSRKSKKQDQADPEENQTGASDDTKPSINVIPESRETSPKKKKKRDKANESAPNTTALTVDGSKPLQVPNSPGPERPVSTVPTLPPLSPVPQSMVHGGAPDNILSASVAVDIDAVIEPPSEVKEKKKKKRDKDKDKPKDVPKTEEVKPENKTASDSVVVNIEEDNPAPPTEDKTKEKVKKDKKDDPVVIDMPPDEDAQPSTGFIAALGAVVKLKKKKKKKKRADDTEAEDNAEADDESGKKKKKKKKRNKEDGVEALLEEDAGNNEQNDFTKEKESNSENKNTENSDLNGGGQAEGGVSAENEASEKKKKKKKSKEKAVEGADIGDAPPDPQNETVEVVNEEEGKKKKKKKKKEKDRENEETPVANDTPSQEAAIDGETEGEKKKKKKKKSKNKEVEEDSAVTENV